MSNEEVEKTLLRESVEVQVGEEIFEIKALVRAEYKKLISIFAEVLMSLDIEAIGDLEEDIGVLINILSERALIELYRAHIHKSEEWINNNMTINQEMELFNAICDVNDLSQMIKNFMKTLKAIEVIRNRKKAN